jgi:flavin-dependent dehydrogenase
VVLDAKSYHSPMRVAVVGGGPAGTFFAYNLFRHARRRNLPVEVTIFEPKEFEERGARNCNFCQGVISAGLFSSMESLGLEIPQGVIQAEIKSYHLVTLSGDLFLPVPPTQTIFTVYRSHGPDPDRTGLMSFDQFLLGCAISSGAKRLTVPVASIELNVGAPDPAIIVDQKGNVHRADVVVGAFGVNSEIGSQFERLGFGYHCPLKDSALLAEYKISDESVPENFNSEIKIFALGLYPIRFGVITPKKGHITVSLIGEKLRADHLRSFMGHPLVKKHVKIQEDLLTPRCRCAPCFPVSSGKELAGAHCLVIGDAAVSRYYKNGIESALRSAELAAEVLVEYGPWSAETLRRRYGRKIKAIYSLDNFFGRILYNLYDWVNHWPSMARAHLKIARDDSGLTGYSQRQLIWILRNMFTGDAPYRKIFLHCLNPVLLLRIIMATLGTYFSSDKSAYTGSDKFE